LRTATDAPGSRWACRRRSRSPSPGRPVGAERALRAESGERARALI